MKRKKVITTKQFAEQFYLLTLEQKYEANKKIDKSVSTGIGPDGKQLTSEQLNALIQLSAWCNMNIFIGVEPKYLSNY